MENLLLWQRNCKKKEEERHDYQSHSRRVSISVLREIGKVLKSRQNSNAYWQCYHQIMLCEWGLLISSHDIKIRNQHEAGLPRSRGFQGIMVLAKCYYDHSAQNECKRNLDCTSLSTIWLKKSINTNFAIATSNSAT